MLYQGKSRYPVSGIIVHCTDTMPDWMKGHSIQEKRAEIKLWHTRDRGWSDIGYHWLIDRDGTVIAGRAMTTIGAHVAGHNAGTIGISLLGGHGSNENDAFSDHFTEKQSAALKLLISSIKKLTLIKKINGHNEFAAKACPGFRVKEWLRITK